MVQWAAFSLSPSRFVHSLLSRLPSVYVLIRTISSRLCMNNKWNIAFLSFCRLYSYNAVFHIFFYYFAPSIVRSICVPSFYCYYEYTGQQRQSVQKIYVSRNTRRQHTCNVATCILKMVNWDVTTTP